MRRIDFTYRDFYRPKGSGQNFTVEIDPCLRQPVDYYTEACRAARHIESLKTGKLYLMYSGGLDSEFMLNVFMSLGIEFVPVVVRLLPDYNQHDLHYADKFVSQHGLNPVYIDINFDDFLSSGKMFDIAKQAKCSGHQLPATMYATSQLDGTVIVADGDPHCFLETDSKKWMFDELELITSWLNWYESRGIDGTPWFMGYTPEMMLLYLTDPVIVDLVNNRIPGKLGSYSSKIRIFNKWFEFLERPKFTGYEKIENAAVFQSREMKEFLRLTKQWNGRFVLPYDRIVSYLRG